MEELGQEAGTNEGSVHCVFGWASCYESKGEEAWAERGSSLWFEGQSKADASEMNVLCVVGMGETYERIVKKEMN